MVPTQFPVWGALLAGGLLGEPCFDCRECASWAWLGKRPFRRASLARVAWLLSASLAEWDQAESESGVAQNCTPI